MTVLHYCAACFWRVDVGDRFCGECRAALRGHADVFAVTFGPAAIEQARVPSHFQRPLGEYLLLERLGAGGMGEVYLALQPQAGQYFAIKLINHEFRMRRGAVAMLQREAAAQSRIVHRSVVRVFRFLETHADHAVVMEVVRGESIEDMLRDDDERLASLPYCLWVASEMALGLSVVHQAGYIHRDVKPGNFLHGFDAFRAHVVKVADFGIARKLEEQLTTDSRRRVAGTVGYMAPEQLRGEAVDVRADLYGLGCVLFRLFAGRPVFSEDSVRVCASAHIGSEAPRLAEGSDRDIPPALADLVDDLLRKDPGARPRSAAVVAQRLSAVMGELDNG